VESRDLTNLCWSSDDRVICVWDNCIDYKLLVYSPDGRCLEQYTAYEYGLGIRTVSWSPESQLVSIGSYDQKLRLMNPLTWKVIKELDHGVNPNPKVTVIYREVDDENLRQSKCNIRVCKMLKILKL
jgi:WD40 repeat protein